MTALIRLDKPGKIGNRPGVRNPTVAALRAFQPRQRVKHQRSYAAKGSSRLLGDRVPLAELRTDR